MEFFLETLETFSVLGGAVGAWLQAVSLVAAHDALHFVVVLEKSGQGIRGQMCRMKIGGRVFLQRFQGAIVDTQDEGRPAEHAARFQIPGVLLGCLEDVHFQETRSDGIQVLLADALVALSRLCLAVEAVGEAALAHCLRHVVLEESLVGRVKNKHWGHRHGRSKNFCDRTFRTRKTL